MATRKQKSIVDYGVLTSAINNAALSRHAALQIELAVGLIHFTQENGGTDTTGKANLKAIYNAAGYDCMTKQDRDYKTVNRRLNTTAKLFDKLGSSLVNGWVNGKGDTESVISYVVTELAAYSFHTLDDVADFVGVESNRTRKPRQPNGPVNETKGGGEGAGEGEGAGAGATPSKGDIQPAEFLKQTKERLLELFGDEMLNQFCAELLEAVAARQPAEGQELLKAA